LQPSCQSFLSRSFGLFGAENGDLLNLLSWLTLLNTKFVLQQIWVWLILAANGTDMGDIQSYEEGRVGVPISGVFPMVRCGDQLCVVIIDVLLAMKASMSASTLIFWQAGGGYWIKTSY
jgi:hypothetical protein